MILGLSDLAEDLDAQLGQRPGAVGAHDAVLEVGPQVLPHLVVGVEEDDLSESLAVHVPVAGKEGLSALSF